MFHIIKNKNLMWNYISSINVKISIIIKNLNKILKNNIKY